MLMEKLDDPVARVLRKEQVIARVSDIVRELVENALDAEALRIQIFLDNFGINRIQVRDDGHGIPISSLKHVAIGGFTEKASSEHLSCDGYYGFRGEALSGICTLANLQITTKSVTDQHAVCASYDVNGNIKSQETVAHSKGTIVTVTEIFGRSPVRLKYASGQPRLVAELKEIEAFLKAVAIVNYKCHLTLIHNGNCIWTKPSVPSIEQSFIIAFGVGASKQMKKCEVISSNVKEGQDEIEENIVKNMDVFVPNIPIDTRLMLNSSSRSMMIFVNKKLVKVRDFEKILKEEIFSRIESLSQISNKYPICVLNIEVASSEVDFNRDMDKSKVFLVKKDEIAEKLRTSLQEFYETLVKEMNQDKLMENAPEPTAAAAEEIDLTGSSENCENNQQIETVVSLLDDDVSIVEPTEKFSLAKAPLTPSPSRDSAASPLQSIQNEGSTPKAIKEGEFDIPILSAKEIAEKDSFVTNSSPLILGDSLAFNDRDWIHGQLSDGHGNIVENVVLVRNEVQPESRRKSNKEKEARKVPTTTPITSPFSDTPLYNSTPRPRPLMQKLTPNPSTSRKFVDSGYGPSITAGSDYENAAKRRRYNSTSNSSSYETQTQTSQSQEIQRSRSSGPRQVTLESLGSWQTSGSSFAKTNSVTSTPFAFQRKLLEQSAKPNSGDASFEKFVMEKISSSKKSKSSKSQNLDKNRNSSFFGSPVKPQPKIGTFGMHKAIDVSLATFGKKATEETSSQSDDSQSQSQSDSEKNDFPEVVARLSHGIYIVRIQNVLGALCAKNLLDMEPSIRTKLNLGKLENMNLLNNDMVQKLAIEFGELSCDDYSEEQVSQVFHCLTDLSEYPV